jgi:hypothetical protein
MTCDRPSSAFLPIGPSPLSERGRAAPPPAAVKTDLQRGSAPNSSATRSRPCPAAIAAELGIAFQCPATFPCWPICRPRLELHWLDRQRWGSVSPAPLPTSSGGSQCNADLPADSLTTRTGFTPRSAPPIGSTELAGVFTAFHWVDLVRILALLALEVRYTGRVVLYLVIFGCARIAVRAIRRERVCEQEKVRTRRYSPALTPFGLRRKR